MPRFLKLKSRDAASFAEPLKEYLPREIVSARGLREAVINDVEVLSELADPKVAVIRRERLNLALEPAEIAEKLLLKTRTLPPLKSRIVIGGARFRNLDTAFPFVEIHLNYRIKKAAQIEELRQMVDENFYALRPRGFTFKEAPGLGPQLGLTEGALQEWSHAVWGPTKKIAAAPLPKGLELKAETSIAFYSAYEREYREWRDRNEQLAPFVRIESEADMETAVKAGLVHSVYDAKGWAGVVAGQSNPFYNAPSIYIFELFLAERLRGKGLGRAMEALFVERVSDRFPYVWGNIHSVNTASLKTALGLGRQIVQTEYFVPLVPLTH